MPIVKFKWHKNPESLEKYLTKDREEDTVERSSHGLDGRMAQAVRDEHKSNHDKSKNMVLEVYQSWPANERGLYSPEKFNEMGQEFAKRLAPGHFFWVYTHTEKNCIHNHVVICAVNSESGKRLENKKALVFKARDINDEIARENGLSTLAPSIKAQEAKLPENVRSMVARGQKSWRYDLLRKVEFARAGATTFDEYVAILEPMKVYARVENKNISYSYGDREKAIRGHKVGKNFTKDGLMKAFKENDERFAATPGLRARILGDIGAAFDGKGNYLGTSSNLLLESASYPGLGNKDYSKFTKIDRRSNRTQYPSSFSDPKGLLSGEMNKLKGLSLLDYCKENKIPLMTNAQGKTVLRGREHIVISEFEYKNTKGRTVGGLLDFVAYHDGSDFVSALAKINKNPRLLLLSHVMGEQTQTYRAFHAPKKEPGFAGEAKKTLQAFLSSRGMKPGDAETLHKSRNVHVGKDKSVWLVNDAHDSAMEFREEPDGKWRGKRHGKPTGVFFEAIGKSKKLTVHADPFQFVLMQGKGAVSANAGASHLVLFDTKSHERLNEILGLNLHISEVHLAHSAHAEERENGRRMEHEMKARFNPFDIRVEGISGDLGKAKGRGPDFSL